MDGAYGTTSTLCMLRDMTSFAFPDRWSRGTRALSTGVLNMFDPLVSYQSPEIILSNKDAFIKNFTLLSVIKQNKL